MKKTQLRRTARIERIPLPTEPPLECLYCPARFFDLDELDVHREHCGPQAGLGTYGT